MIDLHKERKLVYRLLYKAKIPYELHDEKFQDFALYFYTYYKYDDKYKESTYISLLFSNWLSYCAKRYKTKDAVLDMRTDWLGDKKVDFLDYVQSNTEDWKEHTEQEDYLYCDEIVSQLKPLTQEVLLGGGEYVNEIAEKDGVTRQAIENRIKKDTKKVLNKL